MSPCLTIRYMIWLRLLLHRTNELLVRNLDVLGEKRVASSNKKVLASIAGEKILHLERELSDLHGFHRAYLAIHRLEVIELHLRYVVNDFQRTCRYASKVSMNIHWKLSVAIPWRGFCQIQSCNLFDIAFDVDLGKGLGR